MVLIKTTTGAHMISMKPLEKIHPRTKISSWESIDQKLGDNFYSLDGVKINRGDRISDKGRLPVLLNNDGTAVGDLIPYSSWGSSLSNLLTKRSWDMLRHPRIEKNNNVCELCGGKFKVLDVHEVWSYWVKESNEAQIRSNVLPGRIGVQRLDGLLTVCHECHKCFHLGFAHATGDLDNVLKRLSMINGWKGAQSKDYFKTVGDRWKSLSRLSWILDFSGVEHPDGYFTIKSPWVREKLDQRYLHSVSREGGERLTAIVGHSWKFSKEDQATYETLESLTMNV